MPSIEYEKYDLSESTLERLHEEISKVAPLKRFGRYKAWLHYANLKRWRDQGHHFHYLSGPSSIHCTCGLVVSRSENGNFREEVEVINEDFHPGLDEVQRVKGHLNLPSGRGKTVALIYNFFYSKEVNQYFWDVICQECRTVEETKVLLAAREFVKEHNKTCKRKSPTNG